MRSLLRKATPLTAAELDLVRLAYSGEIHDDDEAFGTLLDGLEAQGRRADTAVLYTADHGEAFQEHGHSGHGGTLYQELLHIPMALRLPDGPPRRRIGVPVQQVDVAPTLLGLAGVTVPAEMAGQDLAALCRGQSGPRDRLLVSRLSYAGAEKTAIRAGPLKLVVNDEPGVPAAARFELYDLERDPAETTDLTPRSPEVVEYLWSEGRVLRREQEAFRARIGGGRTREMLPAEAEALRALGYIQ